MILKDSRTPARERKPRKPASSPEKDRTFRVVSSLVKLLGIFLGERIYLEELMDTLDVIRELVVRGESAARIYWVFAKGVRLALAHAVGALATSVVAWMRKRFQRSRRPSED